MAEGMRNDLRLPDFMYDIYGISRFRLFEKGVRERWIFANAFEYQLVYRRFFVCCSGSAKYYSPAVFGLFGRAAFVFGYLYLDNGAFQPDAA